ncbi:hypothetical protein Tco_1345744 [Tanacetum coccineum]
MELQKEFPRIQGYRAQDVTRRIINDMTTLRGRLFSRCFSKVFMVIIIPELVYRKSRLGIRLANIVRYKNKDTLGVNILGIILHGDLNALHVGVLVMYQNWGVTDWYLEPRESLLGTDEEPSDGGPPRVIVYRYDGLPMQPVAPPSPDYMPRPEHPPSPNYYPEYIASSDAEAPLEDQPLPTDASPTALSPGHVADSDSDEDPEEDPEEDHTDYPNDGGDGDNEPSDDNDDDDDTDDEDEEPFEDEGDDEEEEEHLAPADSFAIPIVDPVPSAGDTKAFEIDESTPTPRSPQIKVPFTQTRLCRARKTVKLKPPMSTSMEARIAEHAAAPTPPLPVASPPLPLPSPLTTSPTDVGAPLGYRAARIQMRATSLPLLLPSTSHRTDIPEAEMPPRKRACLTTPTPGLEIEESSAAGAAR